MYVDLPAIIIQQINDGRYLSVRRKCRAIRHVGDAANLLI